VLGEVRIEAPVVDEAEKPFCISYADLMTSLMVLFLVVMLASLVALTRTVNDLQDSRSRSEVLAARYKTLKRQEARRAKLEDRHDADIRRFWNRLERSTSGLGVRINRTARVIDFGSRARFGSGSDVLSEGNQRLLRAFTPKLLTIADSHLGHSVLSRVVVEGYADRRGTYLFNLNLSLDRSQRVLCTLLRKGGSAPLTDSEKRDVRDLFLVGGFSFNSSRRSLAASRRVEIRLEFLPLHARRAPAPRGSTSFGDCSLGS
jgi:outer membrane protein OmpA-like peptidoglycan-associated protein